MKWKVRAAATASKVSNLHLKGQDLPAVWSSTEQTQYLFNKGKTADRLHGNLCCLNPSSLAWMLPPTFRVIDSKGKLTLLSLDHLEGAMREKMSLSKTLRKISQVCSRVYKACLTLNVNE